VKRVFEKNPNTIKNYSILLRFFFASVMSGAPLRGVVRRHHAAVLLTVGLGCATLAAHLRRQAAALGERCGPATTPAVGDAGGSRATAKSKVSVDRQFLRTLLEIARITFPAWNSKETFLLGTLIVQLICRLWVSYVLSKIGAANAQYLVARDYAGLRQGMRAFFLATFPAALLNSTRKYVHSLLVLQIRTRLSAAIHAEYLSGTNFYKAVSLAGAAKLDHPDQRVTADVSAFATAFADALPTILKPALDIVVFTRELTRILGWQSPAFMYAYFLLSGLVKKTLMPSFGRFVAKESELEGFYSTAHHRLVAYSEEIALSDGAAHERRTIDGGLHRLETHALGLSRLRFLTGVFDQMLVKYWASIAGYVAVSMPFLLQLPHTATQTTADITRDYVSTSLYIGALGGAIGDLVLVGNKLGDLAGYTHRIWELVTAVRSLRDEGHRPFPIREDPLEEEAAPHGAAADSQCFVAEWRSRSATQRPQRRGLRRAHSDVECPSPWNGGFVRFADFIKFDRCDIVTPDGQMLVADLSFEVRPGVNVMVTGPNGCGKSSLFRVLGELWPLGTGQLTRPEPEDVFFVTQRPYLPMGTLRDQLIYPHSKEQMRGLGVTDRDLALLLALVDPAQKIATSWRWDDERDWTAALSGGQKQRVAMARLFYHRPMYAVLDECTSAVSADVEDAIYRFAKDLGITIFTVSHRLALQRHHDFLLQLDGRGHWTFTAIKHDPPSVPSEPPEHSAMPAQAPVEEAEAKANRDPETPKDPAIGDDDEDQADEEEEGDENEEEEEGEVTKEEEEEEEETGEGSVRGKEEATIPLNGGITHSPPTTG